MPTCRLSEVMTGWGGKEMTCSRRSMVARTRSTKGTSRFSPGDRVRLYRPSRSITFAWACGTMVTLLASTMITNSAITSRAISAGVTGCSLSSGSPAILLLGNGRVTHRPQGSPLRRQSTAALLKGIADDRGRAVDLQDPHRGAHREALAAVLGARGPLVRAH